MILIKVGDCQTIAVWLVFGASKYLPNHAANARSRRKSDSCHIKANQIRTKLPSTQADGQVHSGHNTVKQMYFRPPWTKLWIIRPKQELALYHTPEGVAKIRTGWWDWVQHFNPGLQNGVFAPSLPNPSSPQYPGETSTSRKKAWAPARSSSHQKTTKQAM